MISRDEAFHVAQAYTSSISLDYPDYRLECEFETEVSNGWLFQYRIMCLRDIPIDQQEQFAGAAGFVISISGAIRELSVPMYIELKEQLTGRRA